MNTPALSVVTLDNFFEQLPLWNLEDVRANDPEGWFEVWEFCNLMVSCQSTLKNWKTVQEWMHRVNQMLQTINDLIEKGLIKRLTVLIG